MAATRTTRRKNSRRRPHSSVSRDAIRRFSRRITERFHPQRIILFGSHAYGKPDAESEVDLLVVMPARNEIAAACRIRLEIEHPFPLDLIVRTPQHVRWLLAEGDSFMREIVERGIVLP